jgi:hypothetical protein
MEAVKLIRLKSGEDIIAYIEQVDKLNFVVREPMVVLTKQDNRTNKHIIMMDHWLPVPLIRHNEAFITENEIVTMLEPTSDFSEYYENAVTNMKQILTFNTSSSDEEERNLTREEMLMMLEAVGPDTTELIH